MILEFFDWLRHLHRRKAWSQTRASGRRGEDLAHRFLRAKGFVIVARNYSLSSGDAEADLIAWDQDTLVVIEVKARETADFGPPERAIGEDKRDHLIRIARQYSRKANIPWERIRFDIVSVILADPPVIDHFPGALSTKSNRARA